MTASTPTFYTPPSASLYAIPDPVFSGTFSSLQRLARRVLHAYPDRLKGIAMILLDDDIEAGITELKRSVEIGLCGAMIPVYPEATRPTTGPSTSLSGPPPTR